MTYAPHTNNDVLHQLGTGPVPTELPLVLGFFRHKDTDVAFEFAERRWFTDDFAPEMPHIIYTSDGPRLAKVLKTVVYVVTDQNLATGEPVVEKWSSKQYREYDTSWVRVVSR